MNLCKTQSVPVRSCLGCVLASWMELAVWDHSTALEIAHVREPRPRTQIGQATRTMFSESSHAGSQRTSIRHK